MKGKNNKRTAVWRCKCACRALLRLCMCSKYVMDSNMCDMSACCAQPCNWHYSNGARTINIGMITKSVHVQLTAIVDHIIRANPVNAAVPWYSDRCSYGSVAILLIVLCCEMQVLESLLFYDVFAWLITVLGKVLQSNASSVLQFGYIHESHT